MQEKRFVLCDNRGFYLSPYVMMTDDEAESINGGFVQRGIDLAWRCFE